MTSIPSKARATILVAAVCVSKINHKEGSVKTLPQEMVGQTSTCTAKAHRAIHATTSNCMLGHISNIIFCRQGLLTLKVFETSAEERIKSILSSSFIAKN
jgi:hypothetical protein